MRTIYYLAISVFLLCLATIVVKMTFWPVCIGATSCDGWTVAGLAATMLGVGAAFLTILGAIAVAAWWTGLDDRVERHVTQLFSARIQAVHDSIDQLNEQVQAVQPFFSRLDGRVQGVQDSIVLLNEQVQAVQSFIDQLNERADDLRAKVNAIEEMMTGLDLKINIAQQSAQLALDETLPPYAKAFREHNQRMQKIADQQEQSPDGQ